MNFPDIDNPTIGLLICKDKDNVVAKYALDLVHIKKRSIPHFI